MEVSVQEAAKILKNGGIIAYPTEAVFGFGCNPLNQESLAKVIEIKKRDLSKGLILVASNLSQLLPFIEIDKIPDYIWEDLKRLWPGPFTFIVPCSSLVPQLLSGGRNTIAVRVSSHPTVQKLCKLADMALVSTSCNVSGKEPLHTFREVEACFGNKVDGVINEAVGNSFMPTEIRDALTGKILRKGDSSMDKYAVLGNPVEHSRSPFIHNKFAMIEQQNLTYGRILCPLHEFIGTVDNFKREGGCGLNITVPFKEDALKYADKMTSRARRAGAANTLRFDKDGVVWADNTDGAGIIWDFKRLGWNLQAKRILILGAGGATRGIVGPIVDEQAAVVTIVNRTVEKAQAIARLFVDANVKVNACSYDDLNLSNESFDLIINATSCSLHGALPDVSESILKSCHYAYDLMYGDKDTTFISKVRALGNAECADGLGMLVGQAALSFKFWRGVMPNAQVVLDELRQMI